MIKAKAKAERAAARQAAQAPLVAACLIAPPPVEDPSTTAANMAETPQEPEEVAPTPASSRTDLLRSKPLVVGRFMQLTVPILIDVYAASVITPVRVKTMTGLLKAVSFLDAEGLKRVLTVSLTPIHLNQLVMICTVCPRCEFRFINPVFPRSSHACDWGATACRSLIDESAATLQARFPSRRCVP
jgi:hypothetical protein